MWYEDCTMRYEDCTMWYEDCTLWYGCAMWFGCAYDIGGLFVMRNAPWDIGLRCNMGALW